MSNMRTETSVGKDKKSLAASKASKPAPKGSLQLAQIKNLLMDFKGQIKEKKKNTVDTVQKTGSSKNRGGNLSNSNSVSRGNTSMDKNRTSQRSQDQSNRVIKSIDKSDKMKAFKKKDNVAISKEGARSSSNLKNGMKLSAGNSKSINNTSISSVKLTKPVGRTNDSRSSAKLTSISKEPKIGRSTDYTEKRSLDDSRKDLSLVATSDVTKESTKKTKQNGLASSINTNAAKMSLKSGLGSSASKPKKNAVEKSKTEENDENEDLEDSRYKTYTQEQYDFSENTPDTQNMKDFKKKPTEKNGQNSKLNSLVTQVRQGQMFPDFSSKKVDLDRELEIISSNRSHRDRINQNQHGKITHEGSGEWNKYYVNSLIQALGSNDDNDPEVKLFKEHFFQTVQSIVFLQNVEKIDDSLLVEKKVYLPPNFMSILCVTQRGRL